MHNRTSLCELLPHSGLMCLIESIESYDEESIACSTRSHLEASNPLRGENALSTLCGVEYAAQAMALHAGLLNEKHPPAPRMGFLAALREVTLHVARLDINGTILQIRASKLIGERDRSIYEFWLMLNDQPALTGRATVILANDEKILTAAKPP